MYGVYTAFLQCLYFCDVLINMIKLIIIIFSYSRLIAAIGKKFTNTDNFITDLSESVDLINKIKIIKVYLWIIHSIFIKLIHFLFLFRPLFNYSLYDLNITRWIYMNLIVYCKSGKLIVWGIFGLVPKDTISFHLFHSVFIISWHTVIDIKREQCILFTVKYLRAHSLINSHVCLFWRNSAPKHFRLCGLQVALFLIARKH